MYQIYFKRLFDITFSIFFIISLSPIMIFIFFFVWITIGYPIFKQKRPGLNEEIFTLYKFKTLYDSKNDISEENRQNKVGNFLRKTGLDELPQLFNILTNKMSFVGPRPLLVEYLTKYSLNEKKRHLVKPGITGLAQINPEPSGVKSWNKSIKLDIYYTKNVCFYLDIKIILKTIGVILLKKKQNNDFSKNFNNRRLAIIGAGGHGKVIGEIALLNKYGVINFFDDKLDEIENYPFKIVDTINNLNKYINNYDDYFVAIGDNHLRSKKIEWLKKKKFNVVNLLHPQSIISKLSSLGEGTCVMANAVINPGVKIKDGVIINTSASIDHDCIIEDFAHISPNCSLSGSVKSENLHI